MACCRHCAPDATNAGLERQLPHTGVVAALVAVAAGRRAGGDVGGSAGRSPVCFVRSFQELSRIDAGFDPSNVLTFRISGHYGETVDQARLIARIDGTIDTLRGLPGVQAVATSSLVPGVPSDYDNAFTLLEARNDGERRWWRSAASCRLNTSRPMKILR